MNAVKSVKKREVTYKAVQLSVDGISLTDFHYIQYAVHIGWKWRISYWNVDARRTDEVEACRNDWVVESSDGKVTVYPDEEFEMIFENVVEG